MNTEPEKDIVKSKSPKPAPAPRLADPGDPAAPDFVRRPEEIEFSEEDERITDAIFAEMRKRRAELKDR